MAYDIGTVFILMMENRSFDHMLGHLHERDPRIDGIRRDDEAWLAAHTNAFEGQVYGLWHNDDPAAALPGDPPHGRRDIAAQLGTGSPGAFPLSGFVENYAKAKQRPLIDAHHLPAVMGWHDRAEVPVLSFLASEFAVCDRWHAALPADTQPNRLMAMSGATLLDSNSGMGLPNQKLVYDWLREAGVEWRAYCDGLPFFAMMPNWITKYRSKFREFKRFAADLAQADPATFPRVVFIEPTYTSSPQIGTANDDHAPNGVSRGQAFLREVYEAISASPLWSRSITIITYDEHGGFYDHVSPPAVVTAPPPGGNYAPFQTLGLRVPTVVVSPYVSQGRVCHDLMDHTSILKLLGSLFGNGYGYEHAVNSRPVGNVLSVLDNPGGRAAPQLPVHHTFATPLKANGLEADLEFVSQAALAGAGRIPGTLPEDDLEQAFQRALDEIRKFPEAQEGYDDLLTAFPPLTPGLAT